MKIHHLGIACQDIGKTIDAIKKQYDIVSVSDIYFDEQQNASVCLIETAHSIHLELVSGEQVKRYIDNSAFMYHVCYEVENIEATIARYVNNGAVLVSTPKPAKLFNGRLVSFLQTELGLVELLQATLSKQEILENELLTNSKEELVIAIAGNYTIDPVISITKFLLEEFQITHFSIVQSPYNQVHQQLLDQYSLFNKNTKGINILLIKLDEFGQKNTVTNEVAELIDSIKTASVLVSTPLLVCFCKCAPEIINDKNTHQEYLVMEREISEQLIDYPSVYFIYSEDIDYYYPVEAYYDEISNKLAHIAYHNEYYSALSMMIIRKIVAIFFRKKEYKVIVADCDDTLWHGVAAEENAQELELSKPYQFVQQFLYKKYEEGFLICLCSKNEESDIINVFHKRKDFYINLDQVTTHRINWLPKSESIKSIAEELNVALDSVVFIDNNPMESEEVKISIPDIMTIQLPSESQHFESCLKSAWFLDKAKLTKEDKKRTSFYQEDKLRNILLSQSKSLEDFIKSLDIKIQYSPIFNENIQRVIQLSRRTTQFNFNMQQFSYDQFVDVSKYGLEGFAFTVTDRFGDYGLVGAAIYTINQDVLLLKSFFISCRVLGKGIEYQIFNHLGKIAKTKGASLIKIVFSRTKRNTPAFLFLDNKIFKLDEINNHDFIYSIHTDCAISLEQQYQSIKEENIIHQNVQNNNMVEVPYLKSIFEILKYKMAKDIYEAYEKSNKKIRIPQNGHDVSIHDVIESKVLSIWEKCLNISPINVFDNFYDLSGDSLIATRIVAEIIKSFSIKLTLEDFIENPQIYMMSILINKKLNSTHQFILPQIYHIDKTAPAPLSFSQERLWFLNQLEPNSAMYNTFVVFKLKGTINTDILNKTFQLLIERHEILRTYFTFDNSQALQTVSSIDKFNFNIVTENISLLNQNDVFNRVFELAQRPFHLEKLPLLCVNVLIKSYDIHYLCINMHHIVNDTWSFDILCKEISLIYDALLNNKPIQLNPINYSYIDYSVWQRKLFNDGFYDNQLIFWKNKLKDLPTLVLQKRRLGTNTVPYKGNRIDFSLNSTLTKKIKNIATVLRVSNFNILLAIFSLILSRHSGQSDFAIGTPVSGRLYSDFNDVVGFFVNILILRFNVNEELSFEDYIHECKNIFVEAETNQEAPFEKIVESLNPQRELGHNPLCQVMFVYVSTNSPSDLLKFDGVRVSRAFAKNNALQLADFESSKFDITLFSQDINGQFECLIEYNTNLFQENYISCLIQHFIILAERVLKFPKIALYNSSMFSHQEEKILLSHWNQTTRNIPDASNIYKVFYKTALEFKEKTAIIHNDEEITFEKLLGLVQKYINYFDEQGIASGEMVALLLERDITSVAIMLALLASNVTCVPLDTLYPKNIIQGIIENLNISYLILDETLDDFCFIQQKMVKKIIIKQQINVDEIDERVTKSDILEDINQVANILHTSGSTGTPKGVPILHRAILNLAKNTLHFAIRETDVIGQTSNFSFDASLFEIWGALLNGATLVIIDKSKLISPKDLSDTIIKNHISIMWLTASLLNQLATVAPDVFYGINYLLTGGEALNPTIIKSILHSSKRPKHVINGYGPTECTTFTTFNVIKQVSSDISSIPIGKPLANMRTYVLDKYKNLVPVGVPGELYIAGLGVSKRYINNEVQNNCFITNWNDEPILYKTGDIVRRLEDGSLDFISRNDSLVKIKGYRIVPEDIEFFISSHIGVKDAVILIEEEPSLSINAYIIKSLQTLTKKELILYLKDKLPSYMIPNQYFWVDEFPMTSNGKVNKLKLSKMRTADDKLIDDYISPTTKTEIILQNLFSNLLQIQTKNISIMDSFFDIGGHSLLVIKLINEIRQIFGISLGAKQVLETSSVDSLAKIIDCQLSSGVIDDNESCLIKLKEGNDQTPIVFIHPVGGTVFCYLDLMKKLKTSRACYGIEDPSIKKGAVQFQTIEEMSKYYISQIESELKVNEFILFGYSFGGMVVLEMAHQLEQADKSIRYLGIFDTWIATALEYEKRILLKQKMIEQYYKAKNEIDLYDIDNTKLWLDLNYHRLQTLGFNFYPHKIKHELHLFKANEADDKFIDIDDETNYLAKYTDAQITIHHVAGNHDTMLQGNNVDNIVKIINEYFQ